MSVILGSDSNEAQRADFGNLLYELRDLFSRVPGKTNLLECQQDLHTSKPISTTQYTLPFALKEIVEKEVQDMFTLGEHILVYHSWSLGKNATLAFSLALIFVALIGFWCLMLSPYPERTLCLLKSAPSRFFDIGILQKVFSKGLY